MRRGALLLEVLLAVGLFVGAGTVCLVATRTQNAALLRVQREQEALDLARSKLAELEAGLITVLDLRGDWSGAVGSLEPEALGAGGPARWSLDVHTGRSEYRGLSLVELTVTEVPQGPRAAAPEPITVTLRQLLPLRRVEERPYEADDLLEGVREAAP